MALSKVKGNIMKKYTLHLPGSIYSYETVCFCQHKEEIRNNINVHLTCNILIHPSYSVSDIIKTQFVSLNS